MSRVCTISIYVKNLKEAAKFYGEVMGFTIKKELPYLVLLDGSGVDLVLCQAEESASIDYPNASAVVLGVPSTNLNQTIETLKAKGVSLIHSTPQDFPGGKFVAFCDPSGNVLEFLEFSK